MESYNAIFTKGLQQKERMIELKKLCNLQLLSLNKTTNSNIKKLEKTKNDNKISVHNIQGYGK